MPTWKMIDIISKYDISYVLLSKNTHPEAIRILRENKDKICWKFLSENPSAIDLLFQNTDKIIWNMLYLNPNNKVYEIIKNNIINEGYFDEWYYIYKNEGEWILDYIKENIDNLTNDNISYMFVNPLIFTYDYEKMKKNNEDFEEELIKKLL